MFLRAVLALAGLFSASSQDAVGSRGCRSSTCVFSNSYLRFGSGTEPSVNTWGLFQQPWYYSTIANAWYKLTFSNYPLDTAIGTGNSSAHWSGATILNLYDLAPSYSVNDYSGFIVHSSDTTKTVGHGSITASRIFSISGQNVLFQNTFSLGLNDSFVKVVNVMINNSTAPIQNAYIWVGTRDDFVGNTDVNTKTRGNLIGGNFTAITANAQSSRAIMITNTNEGVLFYSETSGVMTAYSSCCSFANAYTVNPLTLPPMTPSPTDGSYAAVLPLGTIELNSSASITWYYAAGVISSLGSVAQTVAAAQVADAGIAPLPTGAPSLTSVPVPTSYQTPTRITTFTAYPVPTVTAKRSSSISVSVSGTTSASASAPVSVSGSLSVSGSGSVSGSLSATTTSSASISGTMPPSPSVSAAPSTSGTTSSSSRTVTARRSATASASATATATETATLTATPTPTTTTSASPTGTATSSTTPSATQTSSITPTPSTTPTLHIFLLAATPQPVFISETTIHHAPDYTPFVYFVIPITLAVCFCCALCCFGACYYKKHLSSNEKRNTQGTEIETETQTESVDTNVVQFRTVEEPKQIKNAFTRKSFVGDDRT